MFFKKKKLKKFYREYTASWGWGVMIAFDTVLAKNRDEAINAPMRFMYGATNLQALDFIKELPENEYDISDLELSKKYGQKE